MNADRHLVAVGIAHLVDVADLGRHRFDLARHQLNRLAFGDQAAVGCALEALGELCAAQHADQPPHPMVVDRRALPRPPDKADDAETLARIGMQQELLVALGVGLGKFIGEPIVMADQLRQQLAATVQQVAFPWVAVDQFRQGAYEGSESLGVSGLGHGTSIVWSQGWGYLSIMFIVNMLFFND